MTNTTNQPRSIVLRMHISEFWSGDLGLTLVTIALAVLIFVIVPLRDAALPGRIFFDLFVFVLMISAALVVNQSRIATVVVIAVVLATGVVLAAARMHPTPSLEILGSFLVTVTLMLYVRIVLLVTFRAGQITWSRIQGGLSAYLLIGMVWASAFQLMEELHPGSFQFVSAPADMDQLSSKLTYYSFATLTTVGSNISPIYPFARSLSIAESVVGQLFPAVLMGALVAMALQYRPKS
jgi:hypothetical protein